MRQEILRMSHIICTEHERPLLNDLSFQVFTGEIYGILMLDRRGGAEMYELLGKNREVAHGQVFFCDQLVVAPGMGNWKTGQVAVIGRESRLIDELSLADNIFVIRPDFKRFYIHERSIEQQAQRLAEAYGLRLSVATPVSQLRPYERLVTELLRAVVADARLILLRDIPDILGSKELAMFHSLIRRMAGEGFTFLYGYNHHEVLRSVCDRVAVFKEGRVEKVLENTESFRSQIRIMANHAYETLQTLEPLNPKNLRHGNPVVSLKHVCHGALQDFDMDIFSGETLLLIDQTNTVLDDLMELFVLANQHQAPPGFFYAHRDPIRVGIIPQDPISGTLYWELSALENLCMPLGEKMPGFWRKQNLRRHVERECRPELGTLLDAQDLYGLHSPELYSLVYHRYLLARPDLVVCVQPMAGQDMYVRTHILRLVNRLCRSGIPVLILVADLFDTIYVADRVLRIEGGRVTAEYDRADFDKMPLNQQDLWSDG